MTPTIKTLTAVAALAFAAGTAMAQETQVVPLAQPDNAAITAPEAGTTYVVNPDGTRETLTAEEATEDASPASDEVAEAEPELEATTPEAEAEAEAEAEEVSAVEAEAVEPEAPFERQIVDIDFSFEGPFGKYDQLQLQRGLQVYTEVCAACHGLQYVPLRNLGDATGPGYPEEQVRAYAAQFDKVDPETGDDVPREPTDHFPTVPMTDGMGPDLSLMAKARAGFSGPYGTGINQFLKGMGGPEYIYSLLTGYTGESRTVAGSTLYENTAFEGGWTSMPPPLMDESVTFQDGHPNDLKSEAKEVAAFLMWAAEPKMMQRKQMGVVAVLFLTVLSVLLYLTNKRLWAPYKRKQD